MSTDTDITFKMLLVDDEQDLATAFSDYLTHRGVINDVCFNPLEALEKIKTENYLMILSDISMPHMKGLELLKEVRKLGNDVPFVFLTGFSDEAKVKEALRMGATDFLDKPCNLNTMYDVVCRVMEIGRRQERIKNSGSAEQASKDLSMIQKLRLKGLS